MRTLNKRISHQSHWNIETWSKLSFLSAWLGFSWTLQDVLHCCPMTLDLGDPLAKWRQMTPWKWWTHLWKILFIKEVRFIELKKYFYSNDNTNLFYLLIKPYFVIILIEEARSDCGGGCFNVRNCYLQACKKCPRCRHWKGGEHVNGQSN